MSQIAPEFKPPDFAGIKTKKITVHGDGSSFPDSGSFEGAPSVCPPWDQANPEYVQATAEDLFIRKLDELPKIIGIVRGSEVPPSELIGWGYPATTVLNFYEDFADTMGPDSFLDGLDFMRSRGELPEVSEGIQRTRWRLPGHGAPSGKYPCGHFMSRLTYGCPMGHELHAVPHTCDRLDCPVCYPFKVQAMADNIRRHLNIVNQLYDGLTWYHVVVSPPQGPAIEDWSTLEGFNRSREECRKVLTRTGVLGGVGIPHPYRQNDGTLEWRAGPHFHFIVNGRVDGSKVPAGWVVKNIARVPIDQVFPLAYYLCSHAGVGDGNVRKDGVQLSIRTAVFFGNCGTNNRRAPAVLREDVYRVAMCCKSCSFGLYRYRDYLDMLGGWLTYVPPLEETRAVRVWCIRSNLDELREGSLGMDAEGLARAFGSDVFVEYSGDSSELTGSDVSDIDLLTAIESGAVPRGPRGPLSPSRPDPCPGGNAAELSPRVPGGFPPCSPGPGGGPPVGIPGAVRHG